MEPTGQVFSVSGPSHLKSIDWNDAYQGRAAMASLVKGVYVMEKDRQTGRQGARSLAPPWWESFGFELHNTIKDDDGMIIGATYKLNSARGCTENRSAQIGPPAYVVALRGTMSKPIKDNIFAMVQSTHTAIRDFCDDARILPGRLHNSSRFRIARETVLELVGKFGASEVFLAGHSLGSSCAMLIGKDMAGFGFKLETYLFNPPFVAMPIKQSGVRVASSILKVGLVSALRASKGRPMEDDGFMALSTWVPHIFVSPQDLICSGYIEYFQHRTRMERIGLGNLGHIATQNTYASLFSDALGLESGRFQPVDIVPSARLTINRKQYTSPRAAHKLHEWWHPDAQCETTEYRLEN